MTRRSQTTTSAIILWWLATAATPSHADTVTDTFQVSATVEDGCVFGSGGSSTVTDLGNIDFGTLSAPGSVIDVSSSESAGSIVLTCTPGMSVTISIDYGLNGGSSSQRYLALDNESLAYQLYQDAARSQVWGSSADGLAKTVASFPETTTRYTVYARLNAVDSLPSAGIYTDTVVVTLSY